MDDIVIRTLEKKDCATFCIGGTFVVIHTSHCVVFVKELVGFSMSRGAVGTAQEVSFPTMQQHYDVAQYYGVLSPRRRRERESTLIAIRSEMIKVAQNVYTCS